LKKIQCSEADYARAQRAWQEFACVTMKDYMMAYLKMDVHQLADVFEAFRRVTLHEDGLDPINYFSIPGLTYDSAFKMTKAGIHLLTDQTQYEFFEAGIRGGITQVSEHHVKANIPGRSDYDANQPRVEMLYVDAVCFFI
jgi:hypothetical protein